MKLYGRKSWAPWFREKAEQTRARPAWMGFDTGSEPARTTVFMAGNRVGKTWAWEQLRERMQRGEVRMPTEGVI